MNVRAWLEFELAYLEAVCQRFSRRRPEGSLFDSYSTEVYGRALLLSPDCSTLPLICTLKCWVLSKEISSTIFWVFGIPRPEIEPWSPGPLVNTLLIRPKLLVLDRDIFLSLRIFGLRCYTKNFSAYMSFGLLQILHVELGRLHRTTNLTLYLFHRGRLF